MFRFPVEENLKDAVAGAYALGIEGINITIPYKHGGGHGIPDGS
jgi:shikimate 5-dehydrogenase